ncbi:MAG: YbbR-like domain-containing protein [Croceitalea sp.]|nr:YbbR-like domain-containing protein [Croceitalea sp.]NNC35446.1 YbbR-like domain-containing protein [Croceitalea sp.]NNL09552.1 YbbR-like domain-containing protein [Croceitalea sp.]NNM17534.1 YbbR-like domain-containing protein [Croceitalea sp.]
MLANIVKGLNKRKVKVFLVFLICSIFAWSISKLSETYETRAVFEMNYVQLPDSLLLAENSMDRINIKLRASGFQFLNYGIGRKEVNIDLREVEHLNGKYFITANNAKQQIEKQLSKSVSLLEVDKNRFFVDLYVVKTKEIPVEANITLNLAQNHILDGNLTIEPHQVLLKGPANEINSITSIKTVPLVLNELTEDFSSTLGIAIPDNLENTIIMNTTVKVSGKVSRFSEKEFQVPITANNVPEGYRVRMFPNSVTLVCKARVEVLKQLTANAFEVVADYNSADQGNNKLNLQLQHSPDSVYTVRLLGNQIDFVLEKL